MTVSMEHINAELAWSRILDKFAKFARNHGYSYDEMMHIEQEVERGWPAKRDVTRHRLTVAGREMVTVTVTRSPMVDFRWTISADIGEINWPEVRPGWEDICLHCGGDILHKRAVKCEWAWWNAWICAWMDIGMKHAIYHQHEAP